MNRIKYLISLICLLGLVGFAASALAAGTEFGGDNEIIIQFSSPVDKVEAANPERYVVFEESDPDIRLRITSIEVADDGRQAKLIFADPLNTTKTHIINTTDIGGIAQSSFSVSKSYLGYLISILISALLSTISSSPNTLASAFSSEPRSAKKQPKEWGWCSPLSLSWPFR